MVTIESNKKATAKKVLGALSHLIPELLDLDESIYDYLDHKLATNAKKVAGIDLNE